VARRQSAAGEAGAGALQLSLFDDAVPPAPAAPPRPRGQAAAAAPRDTLGAATSVLSREKPSLLSQVVPEYLAFLAALGRSAHTIKSFKLDLDLLQRHVGDMPVSSLTLRELSSFIAWVRLERGNEPNSRRRKIATLKNFCAFLQAHGYAPNNEAEKLIYPEIYPPLPDFLEAQAVDRLLDATAHNPFWRALLLIMIDTGLKRDEVLALRPLDLYLEAERAEECYLVVRETEAAKRLRSRRLTLTPRLRDALRVYLEKRAGITPRLFDVTPRGVNFIVETCGKLASVTTGAARLTPQVLRETFAVAQMHARVEAERRAQASGASNEYLHLLTMRHNQELLELLGLRDDPETARKYRRLIG
jgi:integrase